MSKFLLLAMISLSLNAQFDPKKAQAIYKATRLALRGVVMNNSKKVQKAINNGALVDYQITPLGESPFFMAVILNHPEILELFFKKNLAVNQQNHVGDTPLHYAVRARNLELTHRLLAHGASPDIKNLFGTSPYRYAVITNYQAMIYLLENAQIFHERYLKEMAQKDWIPSAFNPIFTQDQTAPGTETDQPVGFMGPLPPGTPLESAIDDIIYPQAVSTCSAS